MTCSICSSSKHRASSCPIRTKLLITAVALALSGSLSGCATPKAITQLVAVDSFCTTASKRLWSVNDSPESIRDARAYNAAVDRRCGVKGKS